MAEAERKEPVNFTTKNVFQRLFKNESAVLLFVLIALIGGMGRVTRGLSIRGNNMKNLLLQSSISGVSAIGQAFVILSAGIDISVAGMGFLSATIGSTVMTGNEWQNIASYPFPIYAAIPIMLLVGTCIGLVNGTLVSQISMPSIIVTLGMWRVTWGLGYQIGGGESIYNLPRALEWVGAGKIAGVPVPIIIFVAVAVAAYFVLHYTHFGRSVYASGGNPASAWLAGINVRNTQLIVFIISGFLAGLAAVVVTSRVMLTSPRTLEGLELETIAAVVVGGVSLMGGKGSIIGVIIGVLTEYR
jgi:ribose/xylose/arabinose/galactoside ABC-type transport system permease subunit